MLHQNHAELVATDAEAMTAAGIDLPEGSTRQPQAPVSHGVSIGIVNALKAVHIKKQDDAGLPQMGQGVFKAPAVDEPGEAVGLLDHVHGEHIDHNGRDSGGDIVHPQGAVHHLHDHTRKHEYQHRYQKAHAAELVFAAAAQHGKHGIKQRSHIHHRIDFVQRPMGIAALGVHLNDGPGKAQPHLQQCVQQQDDHGRLLVGRVQDQGHKNADAGCCGKLNDLYSRMPDYRPRSCAVQHNAQPLAQCRQGNNGKLKAEISLFRPGQRSGAGHAQQHGGHGQNTQRCNGRVIFYQTNLSLKRFTYRVYHISLFSSRKNRGRRV